jgi:hypothetical protein
VVALSADAANRRATTTGRPHLKQCLRIFSLFCGDAAD